LVVEHAGEVDPFGVDYRVIEVWFDGDVIEAAEIGDDFSH